MGCFGSARVCRSGKADQDGLALCVASVTLRDTETARLQSGDELPIGDWRSAGGNQLVISFLRHVVVVQIEASRRQTVAHRESVKFAQCRIAHNVRPERPMRRPHRLIDQNCHG